MKKILLTVTCFLLLNNISFAEDNSQKLFKQGVNAYKNHNYPESLTLMNNVILDDPGNALAHYYLAISSVQLGKKDLALSEYNNVIKLNPNSQLAYYANLGINQLNINNTSATQNKKKADTNSKVLPTINQIENKSHDSAEKAEISSQKTSSNSQPNAEEIANAIKTLAKAGINIGNNAGVNSGYNIEAMKMNMLMNSLGSSNENNNIGGSNNYNNAKMMPYMLMLQNQGNGQNYNSQMNQNSFNSMMTPELLMGEF